VVTVLVGPASLIPQEVFLITENQVAGSNPLPIDRERAEEPKLEASVDWKAEYEKAKAEAVCIPHYNAKADISHPSAILGSTCNFKQTRTDI
jgi:hypothetical protein